jgi:hypothetical protein
MIQLRKPFRGQLAAYAAFSGLLVDSLAHGGKLHPDTEIVAETDDLIV